MKKKFYYAAMFAAGLMTISTSCSNEDEIINEGENSEVATGEQVIVLDMQDTDVLSTKSRPLYSTTNQGAEQVTDVALLVFQHQEGDAKQMKLINVININQWAQNSKDYNYGRQYTIKLENDDKLKVGETYTIVAVGQDESNTAATTFAPYQIQTGDNFSTAAYISALTDNSWGDLVSSAPEWNAGSNVGEGFLKTSATRTSENEAEIFSGCSQPLTLEYDGGFNTKVLLKRQVAGVLGYFSKIPAFVSNGKNETDKYKNYDAVKKIRLVASTKNTQIDLTRALDSQNDDATGVGAESVVNGFTAATADAQYMATQDAPNNDKDAFTVYEIDLTKWFSPASDSDSDADDASFWFGTTANYDNIGTDGVPSLGEAFGTVSTEWVNALAQANDNPRVATNSVLAGEFVIPFNRLENQAVNTFELQLVGSDQKGDKILKKWNVKLDAQSIDTDKGDNEYIFNIYRNHLYQIGQRGGGDSPVDPGTDPDKPQPLDKDQELTIKINDQWEFIHDLEID